MLAKRSWAAWAVVCALLVTGGAGAAGCASGQSIGEQVSDGGGTSVSSASSMGGDAGPSAGGGNVGGGGEGGEEPMGGSGGDDPCALGCPADTWDIDDNPLTGECGCEYACVQASVNDPIDEDFTDDNCDGTDGVVEDCVFVSKTDGSSLGAGTRADPVDTIAQGIAVADTNNVSGVCVSGESYAETVTMVSGISVYGGFDHDDVDFKFRRKASVTTSVQAAGTVFVAANINDETHIEGLTIDAFTPATPGASTYGVRLTGGSGELFVRYNKIHAYAGADGANGSNGTAHGSNQAPMGNNGDPACEGSGCTGAPGGPQTTCPGSLFGGKGGNGNMGGNGSPGLAGNSGSPAGGAGGLRIRALFTEFCSVFEPAPADHDGKAGAANTTPGNNGVVGTKGDSIGDIVAGLYAPSAGGDGNVTPATNGAGGPGGGGGGGEYSDPLCGLAKDDDAGSGGGSGGCGGLAGDYGRGGGGGGGSFGVFAAGGIVRVTDNEITADGGGDGGNGGTGRAGQLGGIGGIGGTVAAGREGGRGGDGGSGSRGGHGGPGGGGGGGPCAILAFAPGVIFTLTGNTTALGSGGDGGNGGTNPGSSATAPAGDDGENQNQLQI